MLPLLFLPLAVAPARPVCHAALEPTCAACDERNTAGARGATDTLGRGAWLIDEENDEVLLAGPRGLVRRVKVGAWPEQLVVESSGRVFVSCRQAGRVDVIGEDFRVASIPIGPEPRALALDEEAGRLYVATVTGRELVAFDTATLEPVARREVPLPATAVAVTALGLAVVSDREASVSFYPRSLDGAPLVEPLGPGRPDEDMFFWKGDFFSEAVTRPTWLATRGDDLIVVSRATATGLDAPTESGGYGGAADLPHQLVVHHFAALSRGLALAQARKLSRLRDPGAIALAGPMLVVAGRTLPGLVQLWVDGSELRVVTAVSPAPPRSVSEPPRPRSPTSSLDSTGVSSVAALGDGRLLLLEPARRELSIVEQVGTRPSATFTLLRGLGGRRMKPRLEPVFATRPLARLPDSALEPELRLGRALFHDAANPRVSGNGMSCANCHVDGREDGLVWSQNGTRRQTPMLAGGRLAGTAPFNWLGSAKTLEANLTQTVRDRLEGEGLTAAELQALSRYVREGLRPVTRPAPPPPALVAEGRALFESERTSCASCHPADFAFTDGLVHDVRSVSDDEREGFIAAHPPKRVPEPPPPRPVVFARPTEPLLGTTLGTTLAAALNSALGTGGSLRSTAPAPRVPRRFDTPSLSYVGLTAPYLHDGSAQTLDALLANNRDRMGTTSRLTAHERRALVAYLESL